MTRFPFFHQAPGWVLPTPLLRPAADPSLTPAPTGGAPICAAAHHAWAGCLPSPTKRIFVSSIFLLKLQVTTLSFQNTLLFILQSRAQLCFDFIQMFFLLSHPSNEKLTILIKHTEFFPVFHTANLSHFESQTTSGMLPYNVLLCGICKEKFGDTKIWEPATAEGPSIFSSICHTPHHHLSTQAEWWEMKC